MRASAPSGLDERSIRGTRNKAGHARDRLGYSPAIEEGWPSGRRRRSSESSASPAEVTLLEAALATIRVPRNGPGRPKSKPTRVIADRAYDSDPLRDRLRRRGIELIVPYRKNRRWPGIQDRRPLRRYRKRWKIERSNAWISGFRRLVVRYDNRTAHYRAFFFIACAMITMRWL